MMMAFEVGVIGIQNLALRSVLDINLNAFQIDIL